MIWFWVVRGRKWAPGPLKYLWITAVLHVSAKVQFLANLRNSCEFVNFCGFYGNQWNQRNYVKIRKSVVFTNPWPFTKRLFFLGQIDGPAPWDSPNLEISRNPWNFREYQEFHKIMLSFGNFSRIPGEINFWVTWRVPGGPTLKTLIFL